MNLLADRSKYDADRRKDILLSATNGIDAALKANQLDALLFPGVSSANIGARPGYPTITVPYAIVPVPQGTGAERVPGGIRAEARAVRRQLHGNGVQRAEADRDGVRVRAGDEEARRAAVVSVGAAGPMA